MTKRKTLGLLLGLIWLVAGIAGVFLVRTSQRYQRQADYLARPANVGGAVGEPFLAQVEPSPGQPTFTAPSNGLPCLYYSTRVIAVYERKEKNDSTPRVYREVVAERSGGLKSISLISQGRKFVLYPVLWTEFLDPPTTEFSSPPSFLTERERVPPAGKLLNYEVEENTILPNQTLFVAGVLKSAEELAPDPLLGYLLVYPGSQQECVALFRARGEMNVFGIGFVVLLAVLTSVGLSFALRKGE